MFHFVYRSLLRTNIPNFVCLSTHTHTHILYITFHGASHSFSFAFIENNCSCSYESKLAVDGNHQYFKISSNLMSILNRRIRTRVILTSNVITLLWSPLLSFIHVVSELFLIRFPTQNQKNIQIKQNSVLIVCCTDGKRVTKHEKKEIKNNTHNFPSWRAYENWFLSLINQFSPTRRMNDNGNCSFHFVRFSLFCSVLFVIVCH